MAKLEEAWTLEQLEQRSVPVRAVIERWQKLVAGRSIVNPDGSVKHVSDKNPDTLKSIIEQEFTYVAQKAIVDDAKADLYSAVLAMGDGDLKKALK